MNPTARRIPPVLQNLALPVIASPMFTVSYPELVMAECKAGIGVAAGEPLYVVHLDARHRRVVVGPREAQADAVSLRLRKVGDQGTTPVAAFVERALAAIKTRSLEL